MNSTSHLQVVFLAIGQNNDAEEKLRGIIACLRLVSLLRLFNMARYSELIFCLGVALKRSLADLAQVDSPKVNFKEIAIII